MDKKEEHVITSQLKFQKSSVRINVTFSLTCTCGWKCGIREDETKARLARLEHILDLKPL